ncbi:MAG: ABC transporter ATP-binding protein [Planctomycetaceae bacterium]|nr:ABC transporter ATP-binding protein [Planctomycetaceae bacterium]
MIRFEHVNKSYRNVTILNDLSFEINPGEFTVLVGPSGCGKTTTLKMINRLIEPDSGDIYVNDRNIRDTDRIELRRSIGYVIQQIGLFPNMTVAQNIAVVPKLLKYPKAAIDETVHTLLDMVNMPYDAFASKYPHQLSGGQQQRIGVLRALAASPPIILMDEPFGALDPMTRASLQDEVKNLQQQLNKTFVFVTHDMDEALDLADKIIFMDKGGIVQIDSPEDMLENPATNLIRSFMKKRLAGPDQPPSLVRDFMRTDIHKVSRNRGVRECIELMAHVDIDSLIVTNLDKTYAGTISIKDLKADGKTGVINTPEDGRPYRSSEPFIKTETPNVRLNYDAKACFDVLLESDSRYIVVLTPEDRVAGIVTNTSVAKALADAFWNN